MTRKELTTHFSDMVQKMEDVLVSKNDDYANIDALSNFKTVGAITGTSTEIACLNLIATKVARLGVLLNSGKAPNNESIQDTVLDMANYCVLLSAILSEKVLHNKNN